MPTKINLSDEHIANLTLQVSSVVAAIGDLRVRIEVLERHLEALENTLNEEKQNVPK